MEEDSNLSPSHAKAAEESLTAPGLSPPYFRVQAARKGPVIIPNVLRQAVQGDVARVIRDFDRT